MIISPLESSLSPASDYRVVLPDVPLNLETPKTITSYKTINNGASITEFASNIAGERRNISVQVRAEEVRTLRRIHSSGVLTWLFRAQGRSFTVAVNLLSAIPNRQQRTLYSVEIEIVFVREETC